MTGCKGPEKKEDKNATVTPPQKRKVIEAARRDMLREEREPAAVDDTEPVEVLFVNDDAITVDDILKWARPKLDELRKEVSADEYQSRMIELLRAEIRAQAERRLISQVARKDIGDQMNERLEQFVDGRIRDIVNSDHGGRESRYRDWLRERGITPEEDRERIKREMIVVGYLQRMVGPKVAEPTRREIERFHQDYIASQQEKQKRRMLLIDIPYGDTDAAGERLSPPITLSAARNRAEQAMTKLRAGDDFSTVAAQYSQGINGYNGGDWGWVTREGVRPRWEKAVDELYRLGENQYSDIIQTDDALFIVDCAEIEHLDVPSFEELQPKLIEAFKQQQYELLARELVGELFAKADVRPENPGRFLRAVVEAAQGPVAMR
ncbi:MAG: peptidylprolyl isomerase [Phycisphaerales bacterium]|nr:peptidylprolyl isomerase [Phycisphaerales bacterium]